MDIGFSGWDSWNPVLNPSDPHVTCGPFSFAALDAGDWYQLTKNSLYHWIPPAPSYPPEITSLGNVTYYEGETGNFVEWEVGDDDPLGYVLYMDGMVAGADVWSNSTLSFNVDGLAVGLYNFTLQLFDVSGNVVADTSWVEVLESLTTSSTTPTSTTTSTTTGTGTDFTLDMLQIGLVGGVVVLAVVALVFVKMKR
ncbi:hypothetical protein EU546_06840 [Candidatus Thorarchaeota archaeon]|nr:MAG: hypothetical protein EU546_06840 [Candidatus Thorarchaeota archaeon]